MAMPSDAYAGIYISGKSCLCSGTSGKDGGNRYKNGYSPLSHWNKVSMGMYNAKAPTGHYCRRCKLKPEDIASQKYHLVSLVPKITFKFLRKEER